MQDWQRQGPRFRCARCGGIVSATTGTAYAGIRTDLTAYLRGATALAEGLSIRATGRLLDVDKDTANPWLPVLGQHCQGVMHYFFRNLPLPECELGKLWTFILKKEGRLTSLEKLAEVYGAQQQVNLQVAQASVAYDHTEPPRLAKAMPPKDLTVTQDETFTGGLCLITMDPESNFIILEQLAQARDQTTWHDLMAPALAQLNCRVIQSTSDEAPGL